MTQRRSKLEAVIQHRRHLEQQIRDELHGAKHDLALEQTQLQRLNQKLEHILNDLAKEQSNGTSTDQLDLYYRFIQRQCQSIQSSNGVVKQLTEQCEAKTNQLIETSKEKKLLEQVDEKRGKAQLKAQNRREQELLDEVAGNRHHRKS